MPDTIVTAAAATPTGPEAPVAPAAPVSAVPEKFLKDGKPDIEALAKSYTELEKKHGQAAPAEKPAVETTKAPETSTTTQPPPTATPPGFEKFEQEFQTSGKLSDTSYAEIAKANPAFTKEVVDDFVAYRTGKAQAYENEVYSSVGGKEAFETLSDWASKNLHKDDLDAVNAALADTKNPAAAKLALSGVKAAFVNAVGVEPETIVGGSSSDGGTSQFASMPEALKAIRDPRYKTDKSYHASVDAKMAVSDTIFAGH